MWYFSWILGLLLACSLGVISLLWLEAQESWAREHMAVDPLTQLPCQEEMQKRLREKVANSQRSEAPFSVLYLSLTAFRKQHNLIYNEMDTILRGVAETFQNDLREGVDICSRFAPEAFLIVLPGARLQGAEEISGKIRQDIANQVKTAGNQPVQVQIGIAEYSRHEGGGLIGEDALQEEVRELLRRAEKNLRPARL